MESKVCIKCGEEKQLDEFYLDKGKYINTCKLCKSIQAKNYRENNASKIKNKKTEWYQTNISKVRCYQKEYRDSNTETQKEYIKEYREINKSKINEQRKIKKENDPLYKLICDARIMVCNSFRYNGYTKKSKTIDILGCSFDEFKQHLESKFESWMNWENKGNPKDGILEPNKSWDVDHIIPLDTAKTEEDIIKLNHYTNLQPLCSYFNRIVKRNQII